MMQDNTHGDSMTAATVVATVVADDAILSPAAARALAAFRRGATHTDAPPICATWRRCDGSLGILYRGRFYNPRTFSELIAADTAPAPLCTDMTTPAHEIVASIRADLAILGVTDADVEAHYAPDAPWDMRGDMRGDGARANANTDGGMDDDGEAAAREWMRWQRSARDDDAGETGETEDTGHGAALLAYCAVGGLGILWALIVAWCFIRGIW